jgi:hypothetical protein
MTIKEQIKKDYTIYCDMDGVLADFNKTPNALERFETEKGFFKNLKPIKKNVKAINKLIKKGFKVAILSTSPNILADQDKKEWLQKHLPKIKDIIFSRPFPLQKIDYITTDKNKSILIDDYRKNCIEWLKKGGKAFKVDPLKDNKLPNYLQIKNINELVRALI